jgi:hypothetical protein
MKDKLDIEGYLRAGELSSNLIPLSLESLSNTRNEVNIVHGGKLVKERSR